MSFHNRILPLLACTLMLASVGCASPPANFANGGNVAGLAEPIRFIGDEMPTDVGAGTADVLTMEETVRRALRNSSTIQIAIADVRAALADAKQARLIPNPVIDVALRFPEGGGKTIIEASLTADLLSLLSRRRQISAADNRLRAASADALAAVLNELAEVQQQYVTVQSFDAQWVVLGQRKQINDRMLALARARVEAGESSRLDLLTLDAERVSLDVEMAQAASQRRQERLKLARIIGQPSGEPSWELSPWAPIQAATVDEKTWVAVAMEHRPELQAARWTLAALGDEAAIARFAIVDGGDVGVDAERDGDWSIGPTVSSPLPLFDWGQQRRAKAEAQRLAARHRLTQTSREVIEEVRRAVEALQAAQAMLARVQHELVPLAEQRVQQAEAAYRNGATDVTVALLAEQNAQEARSKLIELQQQTASALYRLHRAVGGPGVAAEVPTTKESP